VCKTRTGEADTRNQIWRQKNRVEIMNLEQNRGTERNEKSGCEQSPREKQMEAAVEKQAL
jgi:hypothetical protein